jgi:hypothetical protein
MLLLPPGLIAFFCPQPKPEPAVPAMELMIDPSPIASPTPADALTPSGSALHHSMRWDHFLRSSPKWRRIWRPCGAQ